MRYGFKPDLSKNWPMKLVSLLLAVMIWILLVPEDKIVSEKTMTVPLEVRSIPAGLEIVEKPASSVDITIKGPSRMLKDTGVQEIRAILDLGKATVYQQEFPLNPNSIYVPSGLTVTSVRPNKVSLKLELTREQTLQIRPTVRGKPAPGFKVSKIEVHPSTVLVRGPESRIKAKEPVTTAPVDVTDLKQTTVFDVDIILPRPELRLLSIFTNVRVTVHIEDQSNKERAAKTQTINK